MTFVITESAIPVGPDDPAWPAFSEGVALRNAVELEAYGTDELCFGPLEVLPNWQKEGNPRALYFAWVDDVIAGRGVFEVLAGDDSTAWLQINVLPPYRGHGIGRALADVLEERGRNEGRSKLLLYASSPDAPGERLASPTGFGSVPLANREVRSLLASGYRLEQVERGSRLALPAQIDLSASEARSGAEYRVHIWVGPTPRGWLADMAVLHTRMSTDAPSAGLEEPEDIHTPERVAQDDANEQKSGRPMLTAVAEHITSGKLAGFTRLSVPAEPDRPMAQEDTLVLREHRGHGLGMRLKLANLEFAQREYPGHPSVITFNAEENRYMLDVNEAIGFVPMGYEGAWRKDLDG